MSFLGKHLFQLRRVIVIYRIINNVKSCGKITKDEMKAFETEMRFQNKLIKRAEISYI